MKKSERKMLEKWFWRGVMLGAVVTMVAFLVWFLVLSHK